MNTPTSTFLYIAVPLLLAIAAGLLSLAVRAPTKLLALSNPLGRLTTGLAAALGFGTLGFLFSEARSLHSAVQMEVKADHLPPGSLVIESTERLWNATMLIGALYGCILVIAISMALSMYIAMEMRE